MAQDSKLTTSLRHRNRRLKSLSPILFSTLDAYSSHHSYSRPSSCRTSRTRTRHGRSSVVSPRRRLDNANVPSEDPAVAPLGWQRLRTQQVGDVHTIKDSPKVGVSRNDVGSGVSCARQGGSYCRGVDVAGVRSAGHGGPSPFHVAQMQPDTALARSFLVIVKCMSARGDVPCTIPT